MEYRNGAKRSDVRRPPRRRRALCFVGVCSFIVGGDKIEGNRNAVESFVAVLGATLRIWKSKARAAEDKPCRQFLAPFGGLESQRVWLKMATQSFFRVGNDLICRFVTDWANPIDAIWSSNIQVAAVENRLQTEELHC